MYLINLQLTADHISITLKLGSGGLWFLCSTLPLKVYLPIKLMLIHVSFVVTEICSTQILSMKNDKRQ